MPCDEAPSTAFDILGIPNRWEVSGITLDAQAEYILNNQLVKKYKVIWLIGHHWRADPRGNGQFILPYPYEGTDPWGKLTRELCFKKFTRQKWYWRTNALFVKAVLSDFNFDNLLKVIPNAKRVDGVKGILNPFVAAWTPVFISIAVAIFLIKRASRI